MNKYTYYKVIQGNYGYGHGWEDEDWHECKSTGVLSWEGLMRLRENLKAYKENGSGQYRVVFKKELN